MRGLLCTLMICLACGGAAAQGATVSFGAAGVPRDVGETRDYDRIFGELKANGVTAFYPTFQYVEAPEPKSLGFETDFMPPCTPDSPAFAALRKHGIRLIALGPELFPLGDPDVAAGEARLKALIACAGRDAIEAVMSYDEPTHQGAPVEATERFYRAVKAVDRTLPVMMVHAPFVMDRDEMKSREGRRGYLRSVSEHSRFADMVGFDVYPIPRDVAQVGSPVGGGDGIASDHRAAVRDHAMWLGEAVPGKRRFMVLQAFSYKDQYEPSILTSLSTLPFFGGVRAPNEAELREMAEASVAGGATLVVWWGQSFTISTRSGVWRDAMSVTKALTSRP